MAINPYDDVEENMFRCFGSNDHVFRAGQPEREASEEVKAAIESQGLAREDVQEIVSNYLLEANTAHQFIKAYIQEAMEFFFPTPEDSKD